MMTIFSFGQSTSYKGGFGVYGDGSDGTTTVSVGATLSRDHYFENLTVGASAFINTNGYRIFVRSTLLFLGASCWIGRPGNNAVGFTQGLSLSNGTLGSSAAGGAGNTSTGSAGGAALNGVGGSGGSGGAGGSSSGGGGGSSVSPAESSGGLRAYNAMPNIITGQLHASTTRVSGAGGGGGGGGDGVNRGGGGGGGGGVIGVFANFVSGNGILTAKGGNGGSASSGNAGGGGGGGGGVVFLVSSSTPGAIIDVNGGNPGLGAGTSGIIGVSGFPGRSYLIIS